MSDDDFVRRMNRAADALPTVTVPTAKVRTLARRRRARQTFVASGLGVAASGVVVLAAAALGPGIDASPSAIPGQSAPSSTTTAEAVSALDEWLRLAREDDRVSDAQLAVVEFAAGSGYLTYEQIDALLEDTATCMADVGVPFDRHVDQEVAPGVLVPRYTHGGPLEVADACLYEHSHYAFGAYQTQQRHVEAQDAALTQKLPEVMACLRGRGASISDDATLDDVRAADAEVYTGSLGNTDHDGPSMMPCTGPTGP